MIYTELTKRAMMICYEAHKGQADDAGIPYVFHPLHLAEQMETEIETCAALLHDVPEDTDRTLRDLEEAGFPEAITQAISRLTHDSKQSYMEYVLTIRDNEIARKVKIADLTHNSDLSRLNVIRPYDRKRKRKYRIAKALLEDQSIDSVSGEIYRDLPIHDEHPWFLRISYREDGNISGCDIRDDQETAYRMIIDKPGLLYGISKEGTKGSFPEQLAEYLADHGMNELEGWLDKLAVSYERLQKGR